MPDQLALMICCTQANCQSQDCIVVNCVLRDLKRREPTWSHLTDWVSLSVCVHIAVVVCE